VRFPFESEKLERDGGATEGEVRPLRIREAMAAADLAFERDHTSRAERA
jgi:hypothetical protein